MKQNSYSMILLNKAAEIYQMPGGTINERLEGLVDIDVPFVREVFDVFGHKVEGVFPKFTPVAEIVLDPYYDSREFYDNHRTTCYSKQMQQASRQLAIQLVAKSSLLTKLGLTDNQIADLVAGATNPSGLTWHHHQHRRKMQLVDHELHSKYKHTGGSYTWNERHFKEAYHDW